MLSSDKTGLLQSFLGGLKGQIATRLAMAVEVDRLMDGHALPHEDILCGLRPSLRQDHADRPPTPLRLFCHPFQDLLVCAPRGAKQKAAIARSTLVPAWNWISQTLLPKETAAYTAECKKLVLGKKLDAALERATQFWPLAAAAVTQALSSEAGRAAARKILGSTFAVDDAREMGLLLSAGPQIQKIQEILVKPTPAFTENLVWEVRAIYDGLLDSHPDVAPYVAVIAMNRLAKPWEALRLPMLITRHTDDTLIAKTDMGLVGEILFDRMDTLKTSIQRTRHPLFDAEILMEEVRVFAGLSSHIVKEIELKRDGEWGKRLLGERAEIGQVMEGFMDRAPKEFGAALPTQKAKGADFSKPVPSEKREMALRYARLVSGSRNFAAAASFAAKQKAILGDLCATLQRYNEDLVSALKAANPARAENVQTQFELCVQLTTILFSNEEAELLRRRARAAQSAAAA